MLRWVLSLVLMRIQQRRELAFLILAGLFLGTMGMLNILGLTRFLYLGSIGNIPLVVAVGALPYPVTFLCTDLISEIWGESKASQLVWVGFIVNCWIILILWLGGISPGLDGFSASQGLPIGDSLNPMPVFYEMRRLAFGSAGASMAAYLAAQFVDVRLFHYWKNLTKGKAMWLRNNGSTMVSQLVDTTAVVIISHFATHILPIEMTKPLLPQLATYIFSGYLFKLLVALADTIPFILITRWMRCWLEIPGVGAEIPTDNVSII